MNDPNISTLADLIKAFYHDNDRDNAIEEQMVIDSWKSVVGDFVASHTLRLTIRNNVLFVKVDADSLRNELLFAKSLLMEKLNSKVKSEILKDIVIT
ncbi:MAG: DUF721 domain-containing protein [Candidatus Limimorpha sp.]